MKIVFIGGAHIDRTGKLAGQAVPATSNPGRIVVGAGGAGLNTARVAQMLGADCAITGPVGDDEDSVILRDAVTGAGIEDALVSVSGQKTGTYLSIVDGSGALVSAVADLSLNDQLTADWLEDKAGAVIGGADMWFVTTNLARGCISQLLQSPQARVAATTVSPAKAIRLRGVLDKLDVLFTNVAEAQSLLRVEEESPRELAHLLARRGVQKGVVSNADKPLCCWADEVFHELVPSAAPITGTVIGAGDALAGTVLAGMSKGMDFTAAVACGMVAAGLTLQSDGPVVDHLDWSELKDEKQ